MTNLNILLFLNYNIYKTAVVVLNMSTTTEHSVLITRSDLVTKLGHEFLTAHFPMLLLQTGSTFSYVYFSLWCSFLILHYLLIFQSAF